MSVKKFIKHCILRAVYGAKASPEEYYRFLTSIGMRIGEGTIFFDPINTNVDIQNPKLVTIGKNVRITTGCIILTHDFSWSVLGGVYGECVGAVGTIDIGNNVFIGVNSVILRNTIIEDNVVIGAGSVVSGHLEANSVYAGNPAKKIMSIEELYLKRKEKSEIDIQKILSKIDTTNDDEVWRYLREYSCYFQDAPQDMQQKIMKDTGYYQLCRKYYESNGFSKQLKHYL